MTITARSIPNEELETADAGTRPGQGRRWPFEALYALLVVGAAALILSIVGRRSGWPLGQQFYNELILVQLYAAHFRHLDFFPVWSSTDGLGLGSPVLLYYQKAFFYVAAPLVLLFGALKPALVGTIGVFLVIGAYGMRMALRTVTDSKVLITAGSIGFLYSNYVFTDWLARGDLPEFTAVMIVPWLLYWCLTLVKERRASLLLIVILPLLVDAHSAIALVSLFAMVVAAITFLVTAGLDGVRAIAWRLLVILGGIVVLLGPTLLAELFFSDAYAPASNVTHDAAIAQDFVPFGSYFVTSYHWLSNEPRLDLQIDYALWIPIAVALVALSVYWLLVPRDRRRLHVGRYLPTPSIVFLLVSAAIYLFLQLRISLGVYDVLSPLKSIDYPYRMLALITPIAIILVVAVAHTLLRALARPLVINGLVVLWLAFLVLLSPVTATWTATYGLLAKPGQLPDVNLGTPPRFIDYTTFKGLFSLNGILFDEYLPLVATGHGDVYDDGPLYRSIHRSDDGAASLTGARCQIQLPTRSPLESLQLAFVVTCDRPTSFALPVTYNSYSSVFLEERDGRFRQVPYIHVASDPRIVVHVPAAGPHTFVVHLPTLWSVLS
jgi:hypothetical protein